MAERRWFLARRIGVPRAKELAFSGRIVPAEEALRAGLAEYVVPRAELMEKAASLAAEFAAGPTFALGLAKRMFDRAIGPSLEDFLELESMVQPQLHHSADHAEGVAAFKEKRPPRFTGAQKRSDVRGAGPRCARASRSPVSRNV